MRNPICWWFGCDPDYDALCEHNPSYIVPCKRCGAPDTCYADLVGEDRHSQLMRTLSYWLWRKWYPRKCTDCGCRFGKHDKCDELPF